MYDGLLLRAIPRSLYWIKLGYNKDAEQDFSSVKEPGWALGFVEKISLHMNYGTELVSCLCYNNVTEYC